MITYVARRLLLLIPVLLGVTIITFGLTRVIPGNPIDMMVSPMATPETRELVAQQAGLNDPMWMQYLRYIGDVLHGDFGDSFVTSQPVLSDLLSRFMPTFELTLAAMTIALVLSIPLGIAAAVWRNSLIDHAARIFAVTGVGMPVFWLGLLGVYVFYFKLHILPPPQGRISLYVSAPPTISGLFTVDALLAGDWEAFKSAVMSIILPAGVLGFAAMAPLARMTRAGMVEALESDYARTARALGFNVRSIVLRHCFRNAILPLMTMTAMVYGYMLGGVVLIENIFAWPGLGRYVFTAITSSDYPAIQGFILYSTTLYVLIFLLVDIFYVILDPRVRL
ncbi:ABC transporter permease [Cohaesibacter marisflavi]|uniref:ABC transporter permease n=1 Tax=Cohaesibacter marisflavi TaxID=655353 RepID=UPI0029C91307|nr:ABC transporter permease [Cohaesibacter marisflavi]